jgi:PKD repeat protein
MKHSLTLALALLSHAWLSANCMLYKIPLDSRFRNCNQMVDATVVSSESQWNKEHSCIYTIYKLQVLQNLSGKPIPSEIHVVVPGGVKDGIFVSVEPNVNIQENDRGLFLLKNNEINLETTKNNCFEIYSLSQGFLEYDAASTSFHDIFGTYPKNEILELISKSTGAAATFLSNEPKNLTSYNNKIAAPAIIDFSPSSISAGTLSVLTIRGSGFGSYTGAATVQFRNPDMTNSNYFASIPDASYINTWTDTLIKVIVPGSSIFNRPGAGNGFVKVLDAAGNVAVSTQTLTVTYNQTEYAKRRIQLADFNSTGGYDFVMNSEFKANSAAADAFERALNTWKCETRINTKIQTTATNTVCYNVTDGINTVAFASSTCTLPAGALGITYSSFSFCNSTQMVFTNMDMLYNPNINWNFTTNAPTGSQVDFESVALHELGHAFGEGHNSGTSEVMYPSITYGVSKRALNSTSDVASVNDILSRSTSTQVCIYGKHKLGNACSGSNNGSTVSANFQTNKTSGCAPLQVQFNDLSTGTPTSWKWDINNDGTVDFVTQNPIFTYVNPGTYSVKLVATNANGNDSTIKTSLIRVYAPLNISMSTLKNVSCYNGGDGQLKGTVTGGTGTYTYNWSNSQTGTNQITGLKAGQYTLTASDASGCPGVNAIGTITQPTALEITSTTRITGSSGQASIQVSGGVAPYSYLWNTTPTQNTPSVSNLTPGTYTVTVTDFNSCTVSANVNVGAPTAVNEAEQQFEVLNFYPNPARDNVNVLAELKDYQDINMELIDLSGRTIAYQEFSQTREINTSFDLSTLSAGMYIFRIKTPEGDTFRKIQKQ